MTDAMIDQAIALASQHHRSGRLPEAESIYRQILAAAPNRAAALQQLGLIAHQTGHHDIAVQLIERSVFLNPMSVDARSDLASALIAAGKLDQAIAAFRTAIQLQPAVAMPHYNLGVALRQQGDVTGAIEAYRNAIRLEPHLIQAHCNLGNALRAQGRLDDAIASYQAALQFKPDYTNASTNLGSALIERGDFADAESALRHAVELNPAAPYAHFNLGIALANQGHLDQAIGAYRAAINLDANVAEFHLSLGNAMTLGYRLDEAVHAYRAALQIDPNYAEANINLGWTLTENGRPDQAIAPLRHAVNLQADSVDAHFKLGFALLLNGDYSAGWPEYQWRWKLDGFPSPYRSVSMPSWDGQDVAGKILFLHAEQGLGDTLQFIRYLPLAQARGGKVIVESPPELLRLFRSSFPGCQIISRGQKLPHFNTHCPLGNLPLVFKTSLEVIPNDVPYILPDQTAAEQWRRRLAKNAAALKVGLVWAGGTFFKKEHLRSPRRLECFAPLANAKGIRFFSLQKGEAASQTASPPAGLQITDWTAELNDFADTAALIANLDLIITSDTAVAHLAGAMGRPTWVLLPFSPDWRWLLNRSDSPWYPTMRLFRQAKIGQWSDVIDQVADALKTTAAEPDNAHRAEL